MNLFLKVLFSITLLSLLFSCAGSRNAIDMSEYEYEPLNSAYFELPETFRDTVLQAGVISDYSNYLNNIKVFIDPGHGGSDKGNRGRDTSLTEAEINLNVARHLKEFLERAGVYVLMSRNEKEYVSVADRAELANYSDSDLFISIHHNAASDKRNFWTDYTSAFYFAAPGEYMYEPFEHNLAQFIQRDLAYAIQNPGSLASFDGTLQGSLMPEQDEYDLLYKTNIPAILVECAFMTNRLEESRLDLDEFNMIEAWGIFNGIAKFYKQDIPEIAVIQDESSIDYRSLKLVFRTSERFATDTTGMHVYFDREPVAVTYNPSNARYILEIEGIANGEHDLKIVYSNRQEVYAKPFNRKIIIK